MSNNVSEPPRGGRYDLDTRSVEVARLAVAGLLLIAVLGLCGFLANHDEDWSQEKRMCLSAFVLFTTVASTGFGAFRSGSYSVEINADGIRQAGLMHPWDEIVSLRVRALLQHRSSRLKRADTGSP